MSVVLFLHMVLSKSLSCSFIRLNSITNHSHLTSYDGEVNSACYI